MNINNHRKLYENPEIWRKSTPETVLERAKLTAMAIPTDVRAILEIGSGDGLIINSLHEVGYDPVALDISWNAVVRIINTKKRVQGNATHLPFISHSFDLVLSCELLEHIPNSQFSRVLHEIEEVARKYIIITVPYQENSEWNYARCPACGSIFNGAYHVRSFNEKDLKSLFKDFRCISLKEIVEVLHPDRTTSLELFIRHHLASEYLYFSPSVTCPLCFTPVDKRPSRNWIGWIAAGIRYLYRMFDRRKSPLWYLAVYEKY